MVEEQDQQRQHTSPFDTIRRFGPDNHEYWSARDLYKLLGYTEYGKFKNAIKKADQSAGVITSRDFAIFQDHGYIGLYGGMRAKDIHAKKRLKKGQEILDFMGSDELTANAFRSSLTRQKIQREQVKEKDKANQIHSEMGQAVRKTIIETGATLPEDLSTPQKSIQQLEREEQHRIERQQQLSLFPELNQGYLMFQKAPACPARCPT